MIEIPSKFIRLEAFCREEVKEFCFPEKLKRQMKPSDKLIYFSLGTIGNIDFELMKRILGIFSRTDHYYIISLGVHHEKLKPLLTDRMWGERFLPQTKVLQLDQVELAIIHGGNNSLCESWYFGKRVIILPLFYDQLDNGQRLQVNNIS